MAEVWSADDFPEWSGALELALLEAGLTPIAPVGDPSRCAATAFVMRALQERYECVRGWHLTRVPNPGAIAERGLVCRSEDELWRWAREMFSSFNVTAEQLDRAIDFARPADRENEICLWLHASAADAASEFSDGGSEFLRAVAIKLQLHDQYVELIRNWRPLLVKVHVPWRLLGKPSVARMAQKAVQMLCAKSEGIRWNAFDQDHAFVVRHDIAPEFVAYTERTDPSAQK